MGERCEHLLPGVRASSPAGSSMDADRDGRRAAWVSGVPIAYRAVSRSRLSLLAPFVQKLKESGAERAFFAPNEQGVAVEGEAKRPIPGGAVLASTIVEAVSELLSKDDITGLSSRPRIVRHEHDGEDFVLEIVRHGSGIALGIRQAVRPGRALRETVRRDEPPPAAARRDAAAIPARSARQSRKMRAADMETPELDLGSRTPAHGRIEPTIQLADDRSHTKPVKRPDLDLDGGAAHARGDGADQLLQRAREIARDAAREVAREVAREAAQDAAREAARDAAREAARDAAKEAVRDALRDAPRGTSEGPSVARPQLAAARGGPAKIDGLLREMLQKKASDLHLTAGSHPVLRVDGEIHFGTDRGVLASAEILEMVQEIMTPRAQGDFESLHDADFAYEIPGLARFRVNVFQDRQGTGAVLRQIPIEILTAEKLGLPKACLDLCWLSKGLVLVTGPTGSGKSTTLAAMIDFINKNRSDHIITIEDPVEFVHQNQKCLVNQREVGQHTKSFKNALRAALREDPDIVLVGEMRDLETISIAIETAETGHLVFGTLHTTTAISTVDRIIDQFPSDRQDQIRVMLSESLKGVVAQVLCPKIGGGRVAAHEILLGNHAVASMVREGKTFQLSSVMQTSKGQGMVTMNDSLLALVQKRLVDPKQAYLKAVDKNGFATMLRSAGIAPPV